MREPDDLMPCNITSGSLDEECVSSVIEEMDSGQRECQCNAECNELDFKVSISQAQWPSKQFEVKRRQIRLKIS